MPFEAYMTRIGVLAQYEDMFLFPARRGGSSAEEDRDDTARLSVQMNQLRSANGWFDGLIFERRCG